MNYEPIGGGKTQKHTREVDGDNLLLVSRN